MTNEETKEFLRTEFPGYKGFVEHTLVAKMAKTFAESKLSKLNQLIEEHIELLKEPTTLKGEFARGVTATESIEVDFLEQLKSEL